MKTLSHIVTMTLTLFIEENITIINSILIDKKKKN